MVDKVKHILISHEELDFIRKKLKNKSVGIMEKTCMFRGFTNWKYRISVPMRFPDISSLFDMFMFDEPHFMYTGRKPDKGDEWDSVTDMEVYFITEISLLEVSQKKLKARIRTTCPALRQHGIKNVGRHIFEYESPIGAKITAVNDNDVMSGQVSSTKLSYIFISLLLCKLYFDGSGAGYKPPYSIGNNIIRLDHDERADIYSNIQPHMQDMFLMSDYPLDTLTMISEQIMHEDKDYFYGVEHTYYTVLHNDPDFFEINIKIYWHTELQDRGLILDANISSKKGEPIGAEIEINKCDLDIGDFINSPDDEDVSRDEDGNDNRAYRIVCEYFLLFHYIMYCMVKPKKTIYRESSGRNPAKNNNLNKPYSKRFCDEVTILIKDTKTVIIDKCARGTGIGTKHGYEYNRRGSWCTSKKGKRYWRKGTVCCKGRGPAPVHNYKLERSNKDDKGT